MATLRYVFTASIVLAVLIVGCGTDNSAEPAIDTVPPNPPVGVQVTGEGGDLVSIVWTQNAELDLAGYRVYRACDETGLFGTVSSETLLCPWYYDHVTPQNSACYKVTAVDESGNESAFSQAVSIYLNNGWRDPDRRSQDPR